MIYIYQFLLCEAVCDVQEGDIVAAPFTPDSSWYLLKDTPMFEIL